MYAREIEGEVHTFGVSGKLIMNALVMYDHQTRTLWSQILGEGAHGPLKGTKLEFVPVVQTKWSLWLEAHPQHAGAVQGSSDRYDSYYRQGAKGVIGESQKDGRVQGKALVLGIESSTICWWCLS